MARRTKATVSEPAESVLTEAPPAEVDRGKEMGDAIAKLTDEVARLRGERERLEAVHRVKLAELQTELDLVRRELARSRVDVEEQGGRVWIIGILAAVVGLVLGWRRGARE